MSVRILVVEDEPALADSLEYALRSEGHAVDQVADGKEAVSLVKERRYDLLLLDLMLPGLSGIEVCRRVRQDETIPILILTAKESEADRVLGLESGADDYVVKPFSMNELLARVRAILRRRELDGPGPRRELQLGGLRLDFSRHEAAVDGEPVRLTSSELRLLALLAEKPGRVFSRREIMQHLWDSEYIGDQRAADLHISNIRRKIERDYARPERLVTVRGAGYKLVAV
jgi:two-component system response regulator RegX3